MNLIIRRTLLISGSAFIALAALPLAGDMLPAATGAYVSSEAQARGGDDDGDDDHGSGNDRSDDRGDRDRSGRSRDDDDDDHGRHGSDDDRDEHDDDDDGEDEHGRRHGSGRDRDDIRLIVNESQLQGLLNGSMIAVDQNGRRLRFEVEQEHGNTEIKLRAPKDTLTGVTVMPKP